MGEGSRKSKVTPETLAESARLRAIWDARPTPRMSQAEFGEKYGIGNQSAVGQFLSGKVPLSPKAARGFADGLGCQIGDFSPRLAAKAEHFAGVVGASGLTAEAISLASALDALPAEQRERTLSMCWQFIEFATVGRPREAVDPIRTGYAELAEITVSRKNSPTSDTGNAPNTVEPQNQLPVRTALERASLESLEAEVEQRLSDRRSTRGKGGGGY